jgi:hypothetical protein
MMQDAGYRMQDARYRMQDARYRMQDEIAAIASQRNDKYLNPPLIWIY